MTTRRTAVMPILPPPPPPRNLVWTTTTTTWRAAAEQLQQQQQQQRPFLQLHDSSTKSDTTRLLLAGSSSKNCFTRSVACSFEVWILLIVTAYIQDTLVKAPCSARMILARSRSRSSRSQDLIPPFKFALQSQFHSHLSTQPSTLIRRSIDLT